LKKGTEILSVADHDQLIQDFQWDYSGAFCATTSKDKHIRIYDIRAQQQVALINEAHEGAKSSKITYLGPSGFLFSVGFTKQSMRQLKIWDPRNITEPLKKLDIDQAAGAIMPFFDPDTNLLYLAGKGDGNIRYYEIVNENPYCFAISEFRSTTAAKGMAFVPKRGLDVMKCETARALKLTSTTVEPLSFIVPRKSDAFQEDIFPPTFAGVPSQNCDEWLSGMLNNMVLQSLDPGNTSQPIVLSQSTQVVFSAPKTNSQLQNELDQAKLRIAELEKRLAEAGLSTA